MADNAITIEVNGRPLQARKGQMLIEVTDANGIYVPRFCYHKKLSVAANCRMCLVEVEKAPKPLPACATPVMDGMKVHTRSPLAVDAQKAVMEFLLINHPLDCPICDQGGECELQDLAMGYGRDVSRYQEQKRVVQDKDIGPLVQTDMTRCIHCTRCVRFGEEIAGLRELGGIGRGEHLLIGTYVEKSMVSELSGNVIDLCPVGALTSKPFRFSARTWEMRQEQGIAPHDGIGSNLYFHLKGNVVKRVVPAENEAINETWLSDRDRFSYEGLYSFQRLLQPMVKQDGAWRAVDWMTALQVVKDRLQLIRDDAGAGQIGALASATATTEELFLLQKFLRGLGSSNIDHRLRQGDFSDQDAAPVFPWLGLRIGELEQLDAVLVVGANTRKQHPLINHRLRKAVQKGAAVMLVNPLDYELNYAVHARATVAPDRIAATLAGVARALLAAGKPAADDGLAGLLAGITPDDTQSRMAACLSNSSKAAVLVGELAAANRDFPAIRYLAGVIAQMSGASFGYLNDTANGAGAWLAGAVPHRTAGGAAVSAPGLDAAAMLERGLAAYLLYNVEPELDCWSGSRALASMQSAQCVVAITPFRTGSMDEYADVLLPMALYAENEGAYVNLEGVSQRFRAVVHPPGEARPGWKILRVLGNAFDLAGFDYDTVADIGAELDPLLAGVTPANLGAWRRPRAVTAGNGALQRQTEVPMNSVDPLVRRATALQQTGEVADAAARVNRRTAEQHGIAGRDRVRLIQDGARAELSLVIDERVADNTVLIHGAHPDTTSAGTWSGGVTIEPA